MTYAEFFERVTGHEPYPYQERIGTEPWPDVIEVGTGLGKTAAVGLAWLWKRLTGTEDAPRRLVYCLPMRVLVEQTREEMCGWTERARPLFVERGLSPPGVHLLMGGEQELDWVHSPAVPSVIVGTQDMLLSRGLMRGYGMSRYQWALHFGLLHNDALWVLDEVQLMGPGLTTSAQLEAFRRDPDWPLARRSRTVWMSATLHPDWLATVDFRTHLPSLRRVPLSDIDRADPRVTRRLDAQKRLRKAEPRLDSTSKTGLGEYVRSLAAEVVDAHRPGTQTLVIVNTVARAQELYLAISAAHHSPDDTLLLHARFRPAERRRIETALRQEPTAGRIVVATQAVEAGVDITSAILFTELAPWASLVQRFGRCNRRGEVDGGAEVRWIDIGTGGPPAPYEQADLDAARVILEGLDSVGLAVLPAVQAERPLHPVLRRRDFLGLFDTEPDLSGFDVDVSLYIRDAGAPQAQVFWRDLQRLPAERQPAPLRHELCPASMGNLAEFLKKKVRGRLRRYWVWDGLTRAWTRRPAGTRPRPGEVLMLSAADGGYAEDLGFRPSETTVVLSFDPEQDEPSDAMSADPESTGRRFVTLADHTRHVCEEVARLREDLDLQRDEARWLETAARWHDVGKAHPAFQAGLLDHWGRGPEAGTDPPGNEVWAKSSGEGRLAYRLPEPTAGNGAGEPRRYFRHELASMLAWLEAGDGDDLVAYLIAAHHGKIRLVLRPLPDEPHQAGGARLARGVRDGDRLPAVELPELSVPEVTLSLDLMELGRGHHGGSWSERTLGLLDRYGPFCLSWLEALLRVADQRASVGELEISGASALGGPA